MDFYKKKSLKFSHEHISRDIRHAEAVKARESSRFKRLSMIRSITDSNILSDEDSMSPALPAKMSNMVTEVKNVACISSETTSTDTADVLKGTEKDLKPSNKKEKTRMDMLYKWKQEKLVKRELENKLKKKPFYAGAIKDQTSAVNSPITKLSQDLKSSSIFHRTMNFNVSKMSKSRIAAPNSRVQPVPSLKVQPAQSRIPYNFKVASTVVKAMNTMSKVNPPSLRKTAGSGNPITVDRNKLGAVQRDLKYVNMGAPSKKTLAPGIKPKMNEKSASTSSSKPGSVPRSVNSINKFAPTRVASSSMKPKNDNVTTKSSSQFGLVSRPASKSESEKTASIPSIKPKINIPSKSTNQTSSLPKSTGMRLPNRAAQPLQKFGANLPKSTSSSGAIPKASSIPSRGVPVRTQSQMPMLNKIKKPTGFKVPSKPVVQDSIKCMENVTVRKGIKKSNSTSKEDKSESIEKVIPKVKNFTEDSLSEQSHESIPEIIFNCDVSVIKPVSTSFAPVDFKFQPPVMHNFLEDDLLEALEVVKQKFNRTSTPTKCSRTSSFSSKITIDSIDGTSFVENQKPESDEFCKIAMDIEKSHKLSFNEDILCKETPDILINDEIFNEMDKKSSNKEDANEMVLKKSPEKEPVDQCVLSNGASTDEDTSEKHLQNENGIGNKLTNSLSKEADDVANNETVDEKVSEGNLKTEILEEGSLAKVLIKESYGENVMDESTKDNIKIPIEESIKNEVELRSLVQPLLEEGSDQSNEEISPAQSQKNIAVDENNYGESSLSFTSSKPFDCDEILKIIDQVKKNNMLEEEQEESSFCRVSPPKIPNSDEIKNTLEVQLEKVEMEEEELHTDDVPVVCEVSKSTVRKLTGAKPKRSSMLKRVSVLNSIVETSEVDDSRILSPTKSLKKSHNSTFTPRRSMRFSCLADESIIDSPVKSSKKSLNSAHKDHVLGNSIDDYNLNSPAKEPQGSALTSRRSIRLSRSVFQQAEAPSDHKKLPVKEDKDLLDFSLTPRRSMRLLKAGPTISKYERVDVFSPIGKEKAVTPRRSMRLINLNFDTPEGAACGESKSNLTDEFRRLKLNSDENMNPHDLIDFENSPEPLRSRKVSLLYSPQKRKSMRRSIKGDLMSFSPSTH